VAGLRGKGEAWGKGWQQVLVQQGRTVCMVLVAWDTGCPLGVGKHPDFETLGGSEALSFGAFVAERQGCRDSCRCCAAGEARGAGREGLGGGSLGLGAGVCCRWRTSFSSGSKVVGREDGWRDEWAYPVFAPGNSWGNMAGPFMDGSYKSRGL